MLSMILIWLLLAGAGALVLGWFASHGHGSPPGTLSPKNDLQDAARNVHPTWWANRERPLFGPEGKPLERRRRQRRRSERRNEV
jgi:hypothetical protein